MLHDCFGAVIKVEGESFVLISAESGKPYAVLDVNGLHLIKKRGKDKEENLISLKALKMMIAQIEREMRRAG